MAFTFGPRRGTYVDITDVTPPHEAAVGADEAAHLETLDLVYRSLCALLFNYVPTSGHPGGRGRRARSRGRRRGDRRRSDQRRSSRRGARRWGRS